MQYIRCNDIGEHLEVKIMLKKRGIKIEFTGANMPERNKVVKRCFVTGEKKATTAMIFAKLQPELRHILWVECAKACLPFFIILQFPYQ